MLRRIMIVATVVLTSAVAYGAEPPPEPPSCRSTEEEDAQFPLVFESLFEISSRKFLTAVPLSPTERVAQDLVDSDGSPLSYNAVLRQRNLYLQSKDPRLDISRLNPRGSDLWKNRDQAADFDPASVEKAIAVSSTDTLEFYTQDAPSFPADFMYFEVREPKSGRVYSVNMGSRSHNMLLRTALLGKLGYQVTPMKHMPRLKVRFPSEGHKDYFLDFAATHAGLTKSLRARWVADEQGAVVEFQDVILTSTDTIQDERVYNINRGTFPGAIGQGRRAIESILVPWVFTDLPESLNSWTPVFGTISDGEIRVMAPEAVSFRPGYEDLRWIGRRIADLSQADFQEIAEYGRFPFPANKLVYEKLIAIRNDMVVKLRLNDEYSAFPENLHLSRPPLLIEGKLFRPNCSDADEEDHRTLLWPGYGSSFAREDMKSPKTRAQVIAYGKSVTYSNLIQEGLRRVTKWAFTEGLLESISLEKLIEDRMKEKLRESIYQYGTTGVLKPIQGGFETFLSGGIQPILSRDVIFGQFAGTENLVQMAHSIGVSAYAQVFAPKLGMPTGQYLNASVRTPVARIYTHVQPVASITQALKIPFKNLIVPMIMNDIGSRIGDCQQDVEAVDSESVGTFCGVDFPDPDGDPSLFQKRLAQMVQTIPDLFKVGESIIVTDIIGAEGDISAGIGAGKIVAASARGFGGGRIIGRTHIVRTPDEIQVYRDTGKLGELGFKFDLRAIAPIFKFLAQRESIGAKSLLYRFPFKADDASEVALNHMAALRSIVLDNDFELARSYQKPARVKHDIFAKYREGVFFWQSDESQQLNDRLEVDLPGKDRKHFYLRQESYRDGKDLVEFTVETVNNLVNYLWDNTPFNFDVATSSWADLSWSVFHR